MAKNGPWQILSISPQILAFEKTKNPGGFGAETSKPPPLLQLSLLSTKFRADGKTRKQDDVYIC